MLTKLSYIKADLLEIVHKGEGKREGGLGRGKGRRQIREVGKGQRAREQGTKEE